MIKYFFMKTFLSARVCVRMPLCVCVCTCVCLCSELFTLQASFPPAIQTTPTVPNTNHYAWGGGLLKQAPPPHIHNPAQLQSGKMIPSDLDSSLANLVGSESLNLSIFCSFIVSVSLDPSFSFIF